MPLPPKSDELSKMLRRKLRAKQHKSVKLRVKFNVEGPRRSACFVGPDGAPILVLNR